MHGIPFPIVWADKAHLRRVFAWLTRIRMAPAFGSCSIHNYQNAQAEAIRAIELAMRNRGMDHGNVWASKGLLWARTAMSPIGFPICLGSIASVLRNAPAPVAR